MQMTIASKMELDDSEVLTYHRQILLPEVGTWGQLRLKSASVLVIGAGGLGCPVLLYLTAAGIGKLGIVDGDKVERSNLHRQILFGEADIGKAKAEVAAAKLHLMNSKVLIDTYAFNLTKDNAMEIFDAYDVVVDCTDNFSSRYLINDASYLKGIPNVYGSVYQFEGQVSVFNVPLASGGRGPNYRDLCPEPPAPGQIPSCAEGGVLGVMPGLIGTIQATEVIKLILGEGDLLTGKILLVNGLNMQIKTIRFGHDLENPLSGKHQKIRELLDYDLFCGVHQANIQQSINQMVREITVHDLKAMKDNNEDFQLIDVREPYEQEIAEIGGELIPLGNLQAEFDKIDRSKTVVIHCRSGARSANAVQFLQEAHGFENLFNLAGGILAWSDQIDPTVPKY